MKTNFRVAATWQSAAMLPEISPRRFFKRRYAGLAKFGLCLLMSAFCLSVSAQSYSIDWNKVAGGGGTSTGGTYAVSGIPHCGTSTMPAGR